MAKRQFGELQHDLLDWRKRKLKENQLKATYVRVEAKAKNVQLVLS